MAGSAVVIAAFALLFVFPPIYIYFDTTVLFENDMEQLGGDPVKYSTKCGYKSIFVESLTVDKKQGVYIDANNQFKNHQATLIVSFDTSQLTTFQNNPDCYTLMLYIDEVEERSLPNNAGNFCRNSAGTTVIDGTHAEQFKYSCCTMVSTNLSEPVRCQYNCPIPPATPHEFHENLLGIHSKPIHIKSLADQTPWIESDEEFMFDSSIRHSENPGEMVQARVVASIGFITVASGILASAMGSLNNAGEENPTIFMYGHIAMTLLMIWMSMYGMVHLQEHNSPFMDNRSLLNGKLLPEGIRELSTRGWLVRVGLSYVVVTLSYSYFLVYVPHRKEPDEEDAAEQRFPVTQDSCRCCGKGTFLKCLDYINHPWSKMIFTMFYGTGIVMQVVSMYAIVEMLAEVFSFGPEELGVFAIWYLAACLIYLVAFITAIYEDPLPVVVIDGSIIPKKSLRRPKIKASKEGQRRVMARSGSYRIPKKQKSCMRRQSDNGKFYTEEFEEVTRDQYKNDELWVLHTVNPDKNDHENPDFLNANFFCERVKYHHMCWHVGNFVEGQYKFFHSSETASQSWVGAMNEFWYGPNVSSEAFPSESIACENIVFRVMPSELSSDLEGCNTPPPRLLRVGTIEKGYFKTSSTILATVLKFILRVRPDYSDPMFKNHIVDSLREQMFRATAEWGSKYTKMYLFLFVAATLSIIVHITQQFIESITAGAPALIVCFVGLEFLTVLVLILFTFLVSFERKTQSKHTFDAHNGGQLRQSISGTRGGRPRITRNGQTDVKKEYPVKGALQSWTVLDFKETSFEAGRTKCAARPCWAMPQPATPLPHTAEELQHACVVDEIQYTQRGRLATALRSEIIAEYLDTRSTCVCDVCCGGSTLTIKDIRMEPGESMLIVNKAPAACIDMRDMNGSQVAKFMEFKIQGLNPSTDRVSFGLAYADDALDAHLKASDEESYSRNIKNKQLFACPLSIDSSGEGGECDVSGLEINKDDKVVKLSKDKFYAAQLFVSGHDPSGWLAVSISATDGSITIPVKCGQCGGACHRFQSEVEAAQCDVSEAGIREGEWVFACNYSNGDADSCGHDFWCSKDGLTHLGHPAKIGRSDLLQQVISDTGKLNIGMGFDGHSFFVLSENGEKVALNILDGRADGGTQNADGSGRPLSFIEWGWGAKFYPVVVVYSIVSAESSGKQSSLKVQSRCSEVHPVSC